MCIWYRGWHFEDCRCIIWDKSWSCGFRCYVPRRKLIRHFLGTCPNCSIMNSLSRDPNIEPSNNTKCETRDSIYYPDNVPCDAQYDPSDVFDDALEEHMRHHPWNIMISNSCAAAASGGHGGEAGAWGPSVWGPSLDYDTLLKRYTERQRQRQRQRQGPQQQALSKQSNAELSELNRQQEKKPRTPMETGGSLGRDAQSQPQSQARHLFNHPKTTNSAAWDGGHESDEDPVPPEYRYKK